MQLVNARSREKLFMLSRISVSYKISPVISYCVKKLAPPCDYKIAMNVSKTYLWIEAQ